MSALGSKSAVKCAGKRTVAPKAGVAPLVGQLMRRAIKASPGDQTRIAQRAGISRHTLLHWRRGTSDPRLSLFTAVAQVMGYKLVLVEDTENVNSLNNDG